MLAGQSGRLREQIAQPFGEPHGRLVLLRRNPSPAQVPRTLVSRRLARGVRDLTFPQTTNRILVGDVRAKLAELADNSCHVCVTSPPYFGLRAYNTTPQVWAMTPEQMACDHAWDDSSV